MKKTLIVLTLIAFSLSVNAQSKKDTTPVKKAIQAPLKIPPDSVKIISTADLGRFVKYLRDNTSVNFYEGLKPHETIQQLYNWFINEYNKK